MTSTCQANDRSHRANSISRGVRAMRGCPDQLKSRRQVIGTATEVGAAAPVPRHDSDAWFLSRPQDAGPCQSLGGSTASSGTWAYYFQDAIGSTRGLWNDDGDRLGKYDYTPFGGKLGESGVEITRKFTGHDWDNEARLYHTAYRQYSPDSGRWLTRDPLGMVDGPNVYAYVVNNPVSRVDQLGLWYDWDQILYIASEFVRGLGQGTASAIEGALPFWDPLKSWYADEYGCIPTVFQISQWISGISVSLAMMAVTWGLAGALVVEAGYATGELSFWTMRLLKFAIVGESFKAVFGTVGGMAVGAMWTYLGVVGNIEMALDLYDLAYRRLF